MQQIISIITLIMLWLLIAVIMYLLILAGKMSETEEEKEILDEEQKDYLKNLNKKN